MNEPAAAPPPVVDLVPIDPHKFGLVRTPELVLADAMRAARALKDVLDKRPKKVILGGNRYLEFEDWATCARFYDVSVKVVSVQFVEYPNGIHGFTAHAEAFRGDGAIIAAAEADCLTDEPKWRARPKYVTENGRRVQRGEEPVPMHQAKSMAQTRASAKALRMALSWVVVLAGYKPTPAEEMTDRDDDDEDEPVRDVHEDPHPPPRGPARGSAPASTPYEQFAKVPPARAELRTLPDAVPRPAPVAAPSAPAAPGPGQTGVVVEVTDVEGGALVKLSTGFRAGVRNADLISGLKTLREMGASCELVTRAPTAPGRAPTIIEVLSAPREDEP